MTLTTRAEAKLLKLVASKGLVEAGVRIRDEQRRRSTKIGAEALRILTSDAFLDRVLNQEI